MSDGSFSREIAAHLELQRQNTRLEGSMPIGRYREQFAPPEPEPEPAPVSVSPDVLQADPETEPYQAPPWNDPDSWWNVRGQQAPLEFDWTR